MRIEVVAKKDPNNILAPAMNYAEAYRPPDRYLSPITNPIKGNPLSACDSSSNDYEIIRPTGDRTY